MKGQKQSRRRSQPRLVGFSRRPVSSAFIDRLEKAVRAEMDRFGVSRSFVIATAVAHALGVNDQPDYNDTDTTRRRRHRS